MEQLAEPLYEVRFDVDALGWATFRAADETEAREIAHEYLNTHELEIIAVRVAEIVVQPEDGVA